jgi:hypothetical protein
MPVAGATGISYAASSADVGSTLLFTVTASNKIGTTYAGSAPTAPLAAGTPPPPPPPTSGASAPTNTVLPALSGPPAVGQTLTSDAGSWSGSPTSYAYQWRRCDTAGSNCTPITGATSPSYTVPIVDVGATLRSSVSASNTAGSSTAQSAATASVTTSSTGAGAITTARRFGVASAWQLPWLSSSDRDRSLDSAAAMGTDRMRIDINWTSIQASGPTSYNWAPFDTLVNGLNARGISTLGVIAYTPSWARPAGTSDRYPPTNNADYGNFCAATARHYAPLGVHSWEVWNEANLAGFFMPKPDPAKYTAMLKLCYSAIKAADPAATVLTAGSAPAGSYNNPGSSSNMNGINFLEQIYANGGKGYFDAVAHHPYSFPYPPSYVATWSAWYQMFGTTPSLRSVMTANDDADKKIWATEWGEPTNGVSGDGHVSESEQAADLTEAFRLYGSYSWAGPLFVHNFRDDGTDTSTRENFFGLLRRDFSQKPAWTAFHTAAAS